MDSTYEIVTKSPDNCSVAEIHRFIALVEQGGEVAGGGLQQRVTSAAQLAFLHINGHLAGVAALKHPKTTYRERVAAASGSVLPQDSFPYELGWVFITPKARGHGCAQPLSKAALSIAGSQGVFATSHTDNVLMHRVLANLGFVPSGSAYPSLHGAHYLQVFTRAV